MGADALTTAVSMDDGVAGSAIDVIYLLNSLCVGGSERKTVRVANGLASRGVRVGIAYLNGPEDLLRSIEPGVRRWCLDRKGKYSPSAVSRLRQLLRTLRPRAVIAVNLYPLMYLAPASLLEGRGKPRTIALLNTSTPAETLSAARRLLYAAMLGLIDHIVHGCEANRSQWHMPKSMAWRHSGVIYNGVDTIDISPDALPETQLECRMKLGVPARSFVFGTVGRMVAEKNQRALLDALRKVRESGLDAHLLLVGGGVARSELETHALAIGMSLHVTFSGVQPDVRPALKAMDLFVLPSLAVETFSNAALEAMAMKLPAILSDIGGAGEMIRDGIEGIIVKRPGMDGRLPQLILELAANPGLRDRLGAAARKRVEEFFSIEAMIDNHMALIPQ